MDGEARSVVKRLVMIACSIAVVALVAASLFWWPDFKQKASAPAEASSPSSPPSPSFDVAHHLDGKICERVDVSPLESYQSSDAWHSDFQDAWAQIAEGDIGTVQCDASVPLVEAPEEEPAYLSVGVQAFESNDHAEYKWHNPYPSDAPTEEIVEQFDNYRFGETQGCQNINALLNDDYDVGELWVTCHTENALVVVGFNGFPATSESEVDRFADDVLRPMVENTLREL